MQKQHRIILYILLLIAGAAWGTISANGDTTTNATSAPQAGFRAPDFALSSIDGTTYTLSDLRGKAVLINLWATWCPPCRAEMPAIEKIYREYREKGLVVLSVNATNQDDASAIAGFVKEYGLSFPILLDATGSVSAQYQLQSLPSSYFIDRNGIIQEIVIGGPMAESLLRTRVEKILRQP